MTDAESKPDSAVPATPASPGASDLLYLLVLLAGVLWPLTTMDWFESHEGVRYLLRLDVLQLNVAAQATHPRWIPECAVGRGMPYFTYYAPGFPYLCLMFAWLGATGAVKSAIVLVTTVGAWSGFRLGAEWAGRHGGRLGALLVVASPYPLFNLYVRGGPSGVCGQSIGCARSVAGVAFGRREGRVAHSNCGGVAAWSDDHTAQHLCSPVHRGDCGVCCRNGLDRAGTRHSMGAACIGAGACNGRLDMVLVAFAAPTRAG